MANRFASWQLGSLTLDFPLVSALKSVKIHSPKFETNHHNFYFSNNPCHFQHPVTFMQNCQSRAISANLTSYAPLHLLLTEQPSYVYIGLDVSLKRISTYLIIYLFIFIHWFINLLIYQLPASFCRFTSVPRDPSFSALLFSPEISVQKIAFFYSKYVYQCSFQNIKS